MFPWNFCKIGTIMSLLLIRPTDISHSLIRASLSLPSQTYKEIHFHQRLISQIHSETERQEPTNTLPLTRTHAHTLIFSVSHRHTQPLRTFILSSRAVKFHQSYFLSDFRCFLFHSVWFFSCPAAHRTLKLLSKVAQEREEIRRRKNIKVCSLFYCLRTGLAAYQACNVCVEYERFFKGLK